MIYTEMTKKAMSLMFEKHKDQVDKAGMPYPFHPFHVAESMTDENSTCVALLHDIVEDTDMTIDDLKQLGFNDVVLEALQLCTHLDDQDYYEYVSKLSLNPICINVKLSDLAHNSDTTRLNEINEKVINRLKKYKICIDFLLSQKELLNNGNITQAQLNAERFAIENVEDKVKKPSM